MAYKPKDIGPIATMQSKIGATQLRRRERRMGVADPHTAPSRFNWALTLFAVAQRELQRAGCGRGANPNCNWRIAVIGGGARGAPTVQTVNQPANRYRLQLFVQAQNVTSHANYTGYSGTMTSPFFGRPTNVLGTRKIDIGMSLTF